MQNATLNTSRSLAATNCHDDAALRRGCAPSVSSFEGRTWSTLRVHDDVRHQSERRAARRLDDHVDRIRKWAHSTSGEFVVVHSGPTPDDDRIEEMIAALHQGVDRGEASVVPGEREVPELCIADDGSSPLVARTWQRLARDGVNTVTVRTHPDPLDPDEVIEVRGSMFVIRRSVLDHEQPEEPKRAIRRASWWAAMLVVTIYATTQLVRIFSGSIEVSDSEQRWLDAARIGSVNDLAGEPIAGSSLWPALMRVWLEVFGVGGVRFMSLVFAVIAIACSANASSRLFGRWAARTTAAILTIGLTTTDITVRATPTTLSMAALAIALLGLALVETSDRQSWILMTGLACTVAVVASYQAAVFVVPLLLFLTLTRGRAGWVESRAFRLVLAAGVLAWFLPTRTQSVGFILAQRPGADLSDSIADAVLLALVVVALAATAAIGVKSGVVRRRVLGLSTSLFAVPFARLISDAPGSDDASVSIAMMLVAPAIGGAIAYLLAKNKHGRSIVPEPRRGAELLTVDPGVGRLEGSRIRYANRQVRLAAGLVTLGSVWYLPWAVLNVDWRNWWLAVPFLLANCVVVATALLSAFNNRTRAIPLQIDVAVGHEPLVGVIVPTYSEPIYMVVNTVNSILEQDWPVDRLRIVVSDDAHDEEMEAAIREIAEQLPPGTVRYNKPPKKGDPMRMGESKSGNLNSAIIMLGQSGCEFVETRDSDDLVGSTNFLRATVGHLMLDPGLGFVQTVKETTTSEGDPFNNNEPFFYRGMMLARNTDHGVFPCGSGLVWRRAALREIGHFPVWNLVEDLHSGVLGIRAGWRGLYVPIVGAFAQHSPEDVANVFKQRGTWALDTIRLAAFDRFRGLPFRARLHFTEQVLFYLLSIPLLTLMITPIFGLLLNRFPLDTDATTYAVHFWGFALSIELMLLALAADQPKGSLWRSRLLWIGMAPVYATSAVRALYFGASRKPAYKVTRKTDNHQVYVRMVKVHWLLLATTVVALFVAVVRDSLLLDLDLGSAYWAVVGLVGLGSFIRLSWFGVDLKTRALERAGVARLWTFVTRAIGPGRGGQAVETTQSTGS